MRRLLALIGLVILASFVGATAASAEVDSNASVPIQLAVLVPCTGDVVQLSGELHVLTALTSNGNHISGINHFQPQHVAGSDLSTGAKYVGTGDTKTTFSDSLVNGQALETFVNNFRLIGQGSAPNYVVHENVHLTVNANGIVTASVDNFSISCG